MTNKATNYFWCGNILYIPERNESDILEKWHMSCNYNYCGRKNEQGRVLMKYISTKMKRLLMLVMITMSLIFSGASSTSITIAGAPCDMVCENYIDPTDGQCYTRCCPTEEMCKVRCVITPCEK
jgi:hypothetical protein